ncbi:non-canonical purine NTP pyrophosphatase, RdgB/HAM1 family [Ahniella affigens]|uniref:dITP/XTP pyrophosphatase n=1 Tax=Ahniella affigens TaxID=2021234 RepID=A0A2P1PZE9_9GAMM|nr:RdgB/HAM1 family non-canonical purine NTP pyrophosphatase [Ahniella affigens]AVQ00218.1 non-canonical purine NTP pyrophosphatase, RdgB/HAM1 family [Ahniella affigens]
MMRLVLATGNRGKLAEMREVLADLDCDLVAQSDLGVVDAEETGFTFVENALIKARHACHTTGLPALADDSGLIVPALNGAPGLITAHYAGVHGDAPRNIARLLAEMQGFEGMQRRATFYCVIVFLRHAMDPEPLIAEGRWSGTILTAPRGTGGFGYDPVFFDPLAQQSAAELPASIKNARSHRGLALVSLKQQLLHRKET